MPKYQVTLSVSHDRKRREAVARYAAGGVAGAVIRGTSDQPLAPVATREITASSPYRACVAMLEGTEVRDAGN